LIDLISQKEYKKKATALSSLLAQENGTENAASLIERLIRNW
jgi:UDP:flavonoid glycosyltransferase YjiC (YdhE family)